MANMSHVNKTPADRFRANMIIMYNVLHDILSECKQRKQNVLDPRLAKLGFDGLLKKYTPQQLVEHYISESLPYWQEICNRNEDFFSEHADNIFNSLLSEFSSLGVSGTIFHDLLTAKDRRGKIVTDDDKNCIWDLLQSFIKISIKHVHETRKPFSRVKDGKTQKVYARSSYMAYVDVIEDQYKKGDGSLPDYKSKPTDPPVEEGRLRLKFIPLKLAKPWELELNFSPK